VYISKISLKNIRGFESLEFDLDRGGGNHAGWTVFTGGNGSGKSTLLQAIALCLVSPDARFTLQPLLGYFVRSHSSAPSESTIHLDFSWVRADDEDAPREFLVGYSNRYFESIGIRGKGTSGTSNSGGLFTSQALDGYSLKGWFSAGYGPFRRVSAPNQNVERLQRTKEADRFATLFIEGATLSEVDAWLTQLRFEELEGSKRAASQLNFFLELVRDNFLPDGFAVDHVDSRGLWLRDPQGVSLSWFDMADGHRTGVILLADILRHMISAFGLDGLYEHDEQGKIRILRSGIVLIDEIDAHLHPSWQREIGFWLKRHFPNIQFLVTSHSPIILQAADPNGLFVLPEPGSGEAPRALSEEEYRKIVASTPDTALLSEAFGLQNTRSPQAVDRRARYSRLQAKRRAGASLSDGESNELQQLELFVSADPE
jgi:energy-coupling factor transporter ATP-binding protein EcfA2